MEFAQLETLVKDNPDAVALLKDIAPKLTEHASLTEKVKSLPDLEAKVANVTKLETDIANLKAINKDLETQKATWKAGKTGSEAEFNALKEEIAANKAATKVLEDKLKLADETTARTIAEKREVDLRASVVNAGSKLKGRAPEDDFLLLKAKGLTGLDAEGKPFYHKKNDKGEPVKLASADELMAWYYKIDKSRVSASGNGGIGGSHTGTGDGGMTSPTSRREARAAFLASRAG